MPVNIRINNLTSQFITPPSQDIINIIRHHLRYKIEGAQFIKLRNRRQAVEYKYLYDKRNNTFPTGLLHIVTGLLEENKVDFTLEDTRPDYPIIDPLPLKTMQLREYQTPAETAVLEEKNCIIKIPTGGGKTAIFTSALGKLNGYQRVVIVRRQLLLAQTISVLEAQLGVKVGQIGAGIVDIQPLTVAMVPTVARAIDPKYSFSKDDEDDEDDDTKLTTQQREDIINFIATCHCLVFDECFVPGTLVLTEEGWKRIEWIVRHQYAGCVLSHNIQTGKMEWKRVVNWFSKNTNKELVRIRLNNRKTKGTGVTCTYDHKFYMADGTIKKACDIQPGDQVKVSEHLRPKSKSSRGNARQHKALGAEQLQVALGTALGDGYLYEHGQLARLQWTHCLEQEQYLRWKLSVFGCSDKIRYQSGGYTNATQCLGRTVGWSQLKKLREGLYISGKKTITRSILDQLQPLGLAVWFMDDGTFHQQKSTYSLYTNGYSYEEHLILQQYFYEKWHVKPTICYDKASSTYFLVFKKLDSEIIRKLISPFLIESMKYKGYDNTLPSTSPLFQFLDYGIVEVAAIDREVKHNSDLKDGTHRVYDITVEDNHNFIANGFIVSNCHGIAAESAQMIARHAPLARYRWGFSATPWRSDGKDILIEAATGRRAVDITASSLIEKQFLVPPHIYFLKTPKPNVALKDQQDYQKVYKELVVNNKERNEEIFKVVDQAWERYEHILILVHQIEHGQILLDRFEKAGMWAEYISGSSTLDQRKEIIRRFSNKVRAILIGSSVLDEGVDIPEITTLVNAGGGKSSARYYQKIGRAIRPCGDKKRAIVVDFLDSDIKYMNRHAQERLRIIRTESLYKIKIQGEN